MWEKQSSPKTWVEIDAAALRHNLSIFEKLAGEAHVMAVVKANVYGHGILEAVKILAASRKIKSQNSKLFFGVDNIDEALLIRGLDIKHPVLILGYIPPELIKEAVERDISFSVYSKKLLEMIAKKQWTTKPRVHLKIETGTNRLGMRLEEIKRITPLLKKHKDWIEGVYTHFADTENPRFSFWKEQIARFEEAVAFLKKIGAAPIRHAASSAGALLYPEARYDMIRVGIALYGLWPSKEIVARSTYLAEGPLRSEASEARQGRHVSRDKKNILKPVLSWKTRIAQIKKVKKGETIGYDRTFLAPRDMMIAVLPIGYWDGYDRRLSNKGEVLIQGERARVIGRICMNMMMVNITDIKSAKVEDEAVLLGKQEREEITAEELAEKIGTINYEVVTRINPLITRTIIHDT